MATRKPTSRKRTATKRKKPTTRKPITRKPRRGSLTQRATTWLARKVAQHGDRHLKTVNSRKDAAILRLTHEGCPTCKGNGQIFTKGKDGSFTGSKPCPAKPTRVKASRIKVAMAARFGPDKTSGLCGWTCPCGKREKPRYRDAKMATKALRAHEKTKHGGQTIGGTWYAQVAEQKATAPVPAQRTAPVSKTITDSGMTDAQWEKQNAPLTPEAARRKGLCWHCGGNGALYSAFGGEHITTVCPECSGSGKATTSKVA